MNSAMWKIVLIDDEEGIRKVIRIALEDAGYQVETAPDGAAGLSLCGQFLPQIVITDVRMPGMDGIEVLETIKRDFPETEVIVATAFGEMELAIRALQRDASDFILKPIGRQALELALKRAKDRYSSRKQLRDYTALLEEGWSETAKELIETFRFQNNLIESSMDGILGCSADNRVVTYNKSMELIAGYSKKEAIRAMSFGDFFLPEETDRIKTELAGDKFGGPGRLFFFETSLKGKSGQIIPAQVSAASIASEENAYEGLVCFFRDLRNIRRLEREVEDQAKILHQDKMMSLGRLAASVVHEINNPLAGILNYSRLMIRILKKGALSRDAQEKFERYLELVEKETYRCSQIVSGLLTFSRKSPETFGQVNVKELLNRCVLMSRHKLELSNIVPELKAAEDLPAITGDFNQIQQAVINLIFNAIDAMPSGGAMTLSSVKNSYGQVTISVKDTGAGISEKDLPHIFEPFYTTKDEGYGVGLGLSTVYGIMQRHNGSVDVKSQPGNGAEFILTFTAQ